MSMPEAPLSTSVEDLLRDRFTFSMEFFPPRTQERRAAFEEHLRILEEIDFDFCSITYGAGGTTTELTPDYVVELAQRFMVPTIAHLTCIEHTGVSLEAELDVYDRHGIHNILALRGDPKEGGSDQATQEIPYALDLVHVLRSRKNYCIGVAAHPEGHVNSPANDLEYQAEKISEADYALTQLFYDVKYYERFREEMYARGVDTPIVPGILPLTNIKRVEKIVQLSGATIPDTVLDRLNKYEEGSIEQRQVGEDVTSEMCEQLRAQGAPGLHFYTMNRADSVKAIFERLH